MNHSLTVDLVMLYSVNTFVRLNVLLIHKSKGYVKHSCDPGSLVLEELLYQRR